MISVRVLVFKIWRALLATLEIVAHVITSLQPLQKPHDSLCMFHIRACPEIAASLT